MAEHFYGKTQSLHTTNGGGEMFLRTLIVVGTERSNGSRGHEAVLSFLRSRMKQGAGLRAFDVDSLPEVLSTDQAFSFLIESVGRFAQSLLEGEIPQSLQSDYYNRELQLQWTAFFADFHELLRECARFKIPKLKLSFRDSNDEKEVRLHCLENRLINARRQKAKWLSAQLDTLTEMINLRKDVETAEWLCNRYWQQADLLLEYGNKDRAIEAFRTAASYTHGEDRQVLLDYAEELERRGTEV